jgi:hypothetical protein
MDTLKLPDNLTTLGANAFIYHNFENIIVPGSYIYDENNSNAYIYLQSSNPIITNVENNSPNTIINGNINVYTVGVNGNLTRPEFNSVNEIVYKGTVEQFVQKWVNEDHANDAYGYRQGYDATISCSNGVVGVACSDNGINGFDEGVTNVTILPDNNYVTLPNEAIPFYLPSTLKKLHSNIFSKLRFGRTYVDFEYNGTVEQWLAIEKEDNWAPNSDWVITCTDGTVAFDGTITYN